MTTLNNIRKALRAFGFKGKATIGYANEDRLIVHVNGEYLGIWDAEKNTFVA